MDNPRTSVAPSPWVVQLQNIPSFPPFCCTAQIKQCCTVSWLGLLAVSHRLILLFWWNYKFWVNYRKKHFKLKREIARVHVNKKTELILHVGFWLIYVYSYKYALCFYLSLFFHCFVHKAIPFFLLLPRVMVVPRVTVKLFDSTRVSAIQSFKWSLMAF